jgi:hypothetical protein
MMRYSDAWFHFCRVSEWPLDYRSVFQMGETFWQPSCLIYSSQEFFFWYSNGWFSEAQDHTKGHDLKI